MSTGECYEWRLFAPDGRFFTGGVALTIFQTLFSLLTAVRFPKNNICPWRLTILEAFIDKRRIETVLIMKHLPYLSRTKVTVSDLG